MFSRKKKQVQIERFEEFRTQTSYGCECELKTQFFDMTKPIDEAFVEYLKPFGHPILLAGKMYEIRRDSFFRLLLPIGRTNFHARFDKDCNPQAKELLTRQVHRALNNDISPDFVNNCPEDAISARNNKLSIDLKICTVCLKCA